MNEPVCDCNIPELEGSGIHSPSCAIFKGTKIHIPKEDPTKIRDEVLCPKCLKPMPRQTHAHKDLYQCVSAECDYRRWHTKSGELAFPLPADKIS